MANLSPPDNGNLRFIMIDCYSERSGRPDGQITLARFTPQYDKGNHGIHNFRFLLADSKWQIYHQADQVADLHPL